MALSMVRTAGVVSSQCKMRHLMHSLAELFAQHIALECNKSYKILNLKIKKTKKSNGNTPSE